MRHPALELAGLWVELGLSVDMEAFGRTLTNYYSMGSRVLWFPKPWTWLWFRTQGVQTQPHIIASRLHRPHSMKNKTPRLMVKATFNSQEHSKKLTHLQKEEWKKWKRKMSKSRNQKRREQPRYNLKYTKAYTSKNTKSKIWGKWIQLNSTTKIEKI